ncbi:hypothetical protein [Candidatus Neptunochlamydia vexilliferae]|uniref:hypothetical protein n=1 Tax=Candidatus Neptunichlamydia vexilliferae TaxID=1651774 RepID=UPI00189117DF|nr:hypothetical protein [Candidatus Neptunochlamydia vexilliferae]
MSFELTKLIPVKSAAKFYAENSEVKSRGEHKKGLKAWSNRKAYADYAQMGAIVFTIIAACWDKKGAKSFYYGKKIKLGPMIKTSLGFLTLIKLIKIVTVFFKTYHKIQAKKKQS